MGKVTISMSTSRSNSTSESFSKCNPENRKSCEKSVNPWQVVNSDRTCSPCDDGPPNGDYDNYEKKLVNCTKMVPFIETVPCGCGETKKVEVDKEVEKCVPKKYMKEVEITKRVLKKKEVPCKK